MANVNVLTVEQRGDVKKVVADVDGTLYSLRVRDDAEFERAVLRIAASTSSLIPIGTRTVKPPPDPTPPPPDPGAVARAEFEDVCKAYAMTRAELEAGLGDPIGVAVPADLVTLKATIDATYLPEYAPIVARWGV